MHDTLFHKVRWWQSTVLIVLFTANAKARFTVQKLQRKLDAYVHSGIGT